jgi:hypothetical protein
MGTAYFPTQQVETVFVETIPAATASSFLLLSISGVIYANGYRINYDRGYRLFSPIVDSNGNISILCVSLAYGTDLPPMSINNLEVYIVG